MMYGIVELGIISIIHIPSDREDPVVEGFSVKLGLGKGVAALLFLVHHQLVTIM
jgi:hypothetical protein